MKTNTILDEVAAAHDQRRMHKVQLRLEITCDGVGMSRDFAEADDQNPYGMTLDRLSAIDKRLRRAGVAVRIFRVITTMEEL